MNKKQEFYTKSVLNWLKTNKETVDEYFEKCYDRGSKPNYTDMLRMVSGTTIDDVNLASTFVVRAKCTRWLLENYTVWFNGDL